MNRCILFLLLAAATCVSWPRIGLGLEPCDLLRSDRRPTDIRIWRQGDRNLRLISANEGFCALISVSGHFAGRGEWVGLWIGPDNYWYLGGRSQQEGVEARCIVIPYQAVRLAPGALEPSVAPKEEQHTDFWSEDTRQWRDLRLTAPTQQEGCPNFGGVYSHQDSAAVNGRNFAPEQFIWAHAPARVSYVFDEPITQFRAEIALADGGSMGNVTFQVETESGLAFQSVPIAHRSTSALRFMIEFPPTKKLILSTLPNGPNHEDWAMWIGPQVR